jgi:hypothetical protein
MDSEVKKNGARLIEVLMPLEQASILSPREKNVRSGGISRPSTSGRHGGRWRPVGRRGQGPRLQFIVSFRQQCMRLNAGP